jgi:hypothetical protein
MAMAQEHGKELEHLFVDASRCFPTRAVAAIPSRVVAVDFRGAGEKSLQL